MVPTPESWRYSPSDPSWWNGQEPQGLTRWICNDPWMKGDRPRSMEPGKLKALSERLKTRARGSMKTLQQKSVEIRWPFL